MISIKEVSSKQELKAFVRFPFKLYASNPYWVPPIISEEIDHIIEHMSQSDALFSKFYLAYRDGKVAGRVAAMINWYEVNNLGIHKIRFGWFDIEDDPEICKLLIDQIELLGKRFNLRYMEGPLDASGMDRAGMLTFGFDQLATIVGLYNYPYYPTRLEDIGMKAGAKWQEYIFDIENTHAAKYYQYAGLIEKRYSIRCLQFKHTKEIVPLADEIFGLLNLTYASLKSFVPIEKKQIEEYKKKFLPFIRPDFVCCVVDNADKLIAFSITVPSLSKAFQRAAGYMLPFGFHHLWRAIRKNDHVDFYLIGVDPQYQNRGVTALIFREMHQAYTKAGIKTAETNPQLEENFKIQALWKTFDPKIHKRRQTFIKEF